LPDRTRPIRADDNSLWYEISIETGEKRYIPAADVLHVPGLAFDGIVGYSLISVAMESIGINRAQEKYSGKFFSNGGHVSAVIETDSTLQEDTFTRLKAEVATKIGGLDNAHRIAILEAGLKLRPTNITHTDAQLIEGKRLSIEDWARWLNMPPHKLKEMTHATFSNIEHQNIEYVVDTIRPWLVRFEAEYNRKLFRNKNQFYTKHVVDGLLRGDQKSRNEAYATARNWGWMSANDVLDLEDRNPLPGDLGDIYLVPGNMTRAEDAGKLMQPDTPALTDDSGDDDSASSRELSLTRAAASRVVGYEFRQQRAGKTDYASSDEFHDTVVEWMATTDEIASQYVIQAMNLNVIADDNGIPENESMDAKIDLLTQLVTGGEYEPA
jgi:HK97 family phage portal protein